MKAGIAPDLLVRQVDGTAGWLRSDPRASEAVAILDDPAARESYRSGEGTAYLSLLLTAHWATVATFVPTDVDARIRHHAWVALGSPAALTRAVEVVDRIAALPVAPVSARSIDDGVGGPLSGHDGEWLAVRAGALGRAAVLGARDLVDQLVAAIDGELGREEAIVERALAGSSPATALRASTIVAHNLGALSRVVAEWPRAEASDALRSRWVRLGHPDAGVVRGAFVTAGRLNKAILAHENHRFLPLRKPRALRGSRELLLPIGPWLDGWGETIARHPSLELRDRAEVLAALLEIHERDPAQEGCLRAIAGLHRATRGGIELFVPDLPARMRKGALRGKVRDALDVTESHFLARIDRRYTAERERIQRGQP